MGRQSGNGFAKYDIVPGLQQPLAATECLFNPEVWDGLSERNKEIIKTAAKVEFRNTYETAGHDDAGAYQEYVDTGVEFVVLDDQVIENASVTACNLEFIPPLVRPINRPGPLFSNCISQAV